MQLLGQLIGVVVTIVIGAIIIPPAFWWLHSVFGGWWLYWAVG